jgi:hypothetical protein
MSEAEKKVISAEFDLGDAGAGPAKLRVDNHIYDLNAEGKFVRTVGTGDAAKVELLEGERLATSLEKAFKGAKEWDKISPAAFSTLHDVATTFGPQVSGNVAASEAMDFIKDAQPLRAAIEEFAAVTEGAEKDLAKTKVIKELAKGEGRKYVPKAEFNEFTRTLGKEGWVETEKTISAAKKLGKAITDQKFSEDPFKAEKELHEILAAHHSKERGVKELGALLSDDVTEHLEGHGLINAETAIDEFAGKTEEAQRSLRQMADRRVQLLKDVKKSIRPSSVEKAKKALADHDAMATEFIKEHPANGAAFKELEGGVQNTLKGSSSFSSAASSAVKGVGSAVEDGKKGRGFVSAILYKSPEKLETVAKDLSKEVKDLEFLKKIHGGKAVGLAAATVLGVGYLAGVGRNPAEGKYTGPAMQNREAAEQPRGVA